MKNLRNLNTQTLQAILLIVGFLYFSGFVAAQKIEICHVPPGNPGNAHTIEISVNALAAHLAHGDSEGACGPSDESYINFSAVVAPNPFVIDTKVSYTLVEDSFVNLALFDQQGIRVDVIANEEQAAGDYSHDLSTGKEAGLYYLRCTVLCGSESLIEVTTLVQL